MKQTLTFINPIISSTASKMDLDSWDKSIELYENKKYLESFLTLLDYINPELRKKYGNKENTEFNVPHGSIIVNIKIEADNIKINAPFLKVSDENRVALLRQVASLNMNNMLLAQLYLRWDELYFEYDCPITLAEPYKMYYVLDDICYSWDRYDDEFVVKFWATRIHEPKITYYNDKTVEFVYNNIQKLYKECNEATKEFEKDRKYWFAWNVVDTTLLEILYFAQPQWQLLNDMNKAAYDLDREDSATLPLSTIVSDWKTYLEKLANTSKEDLAKDLYFAQTFIPVKRKSSLPNIQENFRSTYEKVVDYYAQKDYITAWVMIINKFYQMYFYNDVQEDINQIVKKALIESSWKPWETATPILYNTIDDIMNWNIKKPSSIIDIIWNILIGIFVLIIMYWLAQKYL